MSGCCSDNEGETLVFTCAGAAYSGQVANRAGVDLMKQGVGQLFCAAAIAAERPDKLERARNAARRVVIDGCDDDCARRILESAGMPVDLHVDVTALGIEKKPEKPHILTHAKRVVDAVRDGTT
ncbi:MAG TPA: putative zinc-binding protein [Phycisphaerae bacterium]|nr:putative zinc-binding protein [Phycisphaerae bacterium]